MRSLPIFAFALTALAGLVYVNAAPPVVSGNRPVVIEVPVPEADDDPFLTTPNVRSRRDAVALQESGAQPAPIDRTKPRSAAAELKLAREQILKYNSIQAKVVETVAIFDRSFKAEGRYLQTGLRANDWHMRLEIALKVGESDGSLLEVCDGDVLWTSTQIDSGKKAPRKEKKDQTVTRRNVTQILAAGRKAGEETEKRLVTSLGLGGVPALLAAIEQDMKLTGVKEDTLRDRPVLVIQGTWSDAFASRVFGQQPQQASVALPAFVPDTVRVYLDRETGFPLRFLYLKKIPNREVQRAMLTFDFLDVAINQPIDPSEFLYDPPSGIQPVELTNFFLEQLGEKK